HRSATAVRPRPRNPGSRSCARPREETRVVMPNSVTSGRPDDPNALRGDASAAAGVEYSAGVGPSAGSSAGVDGGGATAGRGGSQARLRIAAVAGVIALVVLAAAI